MKKEKRESLFPRSMGTEGHKCFCGLCRVTSNIQTSTAAKRDTLGLSHDLWIDGEISGFTQIKNTIKRRKGECMVE